MCDAGNEHGDIFANASLTVFGESLISNNTACHRSSITNLHPVLPCSCSRYIDTEWYSWRNYRESRDSATVLSITGLAPAHASVAER